MSKAVPSVDVNVEGPKVQLLQVKGPKVQLVHESAVNMPTPGTAIAPNSQEQVVAGVAVNKQKRRVNLLQYSKAWCVDGSKQRTQAAFVARNFSQALKFDACSLKASLIHRWKLSWKRSVRLKDRQLAALSALRRWNYSATAFSEISSEFSIGFATHCVEVELSSFAYASVGAGNKEQVAGGCERTAAGAPVDSGIPEIVAVR